MELWKLALNYSCASFILGESLTGKATAYNENYIGPQKDFVILINLYMLINENPKAGK